MKDIREGLKLIDAGVNAIEAALEEKNSEKLIISVSREQLTTLREAFIFAEETGESYSDMREALSILDAALKDIGA